MLIGKEKLASAAMHAAYGLVAAVAVQATSALASLDAETVANWGLYLVALGVGACKVVQHWAEDQIAK